MSKFKRFLPITLLTLVPTFLIWIPFFLRMETFWGIPLPQDGMATIVANYDGPLYILVAKTFYNPDLVGQFPFVLPSEYYAAHFPMFPILIRIFSFAAGFPYAMLGVSVTSSFLAIYFFSKFIEKYVPKKEVLWTTFVFAIFPARWLIVRSVGSAEPLFVASLIASMYYFQDKKYWRAGIWGVVAQLTKSPGILLFVAYGCILFFPTYKKLASKSLEKWIKTFDFKVYLPILLIPASLLGLFLIYKVQMNDFLAYFHSGDNIHLFFPPFQIFDYSQPWVGTFWLEEIIFVYLFGILGLLRLIKQKEYELSWFVGIFFISIIFVSHRDVIRYALPIVPFILAAFSKEIVSKEFKYAMVFLTIPILLFSLAYISQNVMPISDWASLL